MGLTILDCTIRDGSYAVNFQFTDQFTLSLALHLERVGFKFIEIGHGFGLNASKAGKGQAISTDMEYMEVMFRQLKTAKWGMFFIPGIGRKYDLKQAAKYEMDFVRIGTNVTQVEEAEEYIMLAKDLGFLVTYHLMKSYALPPDKLLKEAKLAEKYGADVVYVVDSAGHMLPREVNDYVSLLKCNLGCHVGFHGHDNLGLAVANSVEAVTCGATYVDATLQGIGRSAGNAQMETLLVVLSKMGYQTNINQFDVLPLGDVISPFMRLRGGVNMFDVLAGMVGFHSSYYPLLCEVAFKYGVKVIDLIVRVSEKEKVNVTEELISKIAEDMLNG